MACERGRERVAARGLALTCAPLPLPQSRAAEEGEEDESEGANYQLEMMRCLREVNVDNNTVGWRVAAARGASCALR